MQLANLLIDITKSLRDPTQVRRFVADPANGHPDALWPLSASWSDLSLANGYPSLLLLFGNFFKCGLLEEDVGHAYVLQIKETFESEGYSGLSLFSGLAGVCFAIWQASFGGKHYQKILETLHTQLLEEIPRFYFPPFEKNQVISSRTFDVIVGLAGVGRYLLEHIPEPRFYHMSQQISEKLIQLADPLNIEGHSVPGWFNSRKDPLNYALEEGTLGNFNLGLAHGIVGVLAYLSIALMKGVVVPKLEETILLLVEWIRSKAHVLNGSVRWPCRISFEEEIAGQSKGLCRDAWCYGAPGITRALFLAGKALKDEELKAYAKESFNDIFKRTPEEWNIPGPMLCHGISGLMMIALEMGKEADCRDLLSHVEPLAKTLLSHYREDLPFGFVDIELSRKGEELRLSKPGFLDGSGGVALALLSLEYPHLDWHLPLMIHG